MQLTQNKKKHVGNTMAIHQNVFHMYSIWCDKTIFYKNFHKTQGKYNNWAIIYSKKKMQRLIDNKTQPPSM